MPIYRIADLNVEVNPKFKYAGNGLKAMPLSRMNRERPTLRYRFRMTKSVSISGFLTTSANKVRRMF